MAFALRPLTKSRIVAAASAIIEESGLEALSMRRLAGRLNVKAPSLYNHFPTKDGVLAAIDDEFSASIDFSVFDELPWREAFEQFFMSHRDSLMAKPGFIPIYLDGPRGRPARLRYANAYAGALRTAGFAPRTATHIAIVLRAYLAGSIRAPLTSRFSANPREYEEYPNLNDAHRFARGGEKLSREAFELGLRILLDGFASMLPHTDQERTSEPPAVDSDGTNDIPEPPSTPTKL